MVFSFVSPFSSLSCFPFRLDIARYAFAEMVAIQTEIKTKRSEI